MQRCHREVELWHDDKVQIAHLEIFHATPRRCAKSYVTSRLGISRLVRIAPLACLYRFPILVQVESRPLILENDYNDTEDRTIKEPRL